MTRFDDRFKGGRNFTGTSCGIHVTGVTRTGLETDGYAEQYLICSFSPYVPTGAHVGNSNTP